MLAGRDHACGYTGQLTELQHHRPVPGIYRMRSTVSQDTRQFGKTPSEFCMSSAYAHVTCVMHVGSKELVVLSCTKRQADLNSGYIAIKPECHDHILVPNGIVAVPDNHHYGICTNAFR